MKIIPSAMVVLIVLCFAWSSKAQGNAVGKDRRVPYIEITDCYKCSEFVISLPDPKYPVYVGFGPHRYNGRVGVQILIDENGKVEKATAIYGHAYFRSMLEKASLKAKFTPVIIDGKPTKISGVIIFQIVSRRIEDGSTTKRTKLPLPCYDCLSAKNAVFLPKPEFPKAARAIRAEGEVVVDIVVNELGNVEYAKAVTGHPLLWASSERAARRAKFKPLMASKRPIRVRTTIVFKYVLD